MAGVQWAGKEVLGAKPQRNIQGLKLYSSRNGESQQDFEQSYDGNWQWCQE